MLPFWPLWLESRGMGAGEIGILLGAAFWVKVATNPLVGGLVDRRGDRRRPMIALAAACLACYALFAVADGFWALLGVSVLTGVFFSALLPLGESLTMRTAHARGFDYGRIRLWGSIGFILTATLGGRLIEGRAPDIVLWLILAALGATLLACIAMPDVRLTPAIHGTRPVWRLVCNPTFVLFLASTGLLQASHAVYYGFATLHWRAAGLDEAVIGALWAEGVVAEILLFAASGAIVRRLGPAGLLLLAAGGGVVRWTATALSTELGVLLAAQTLHALTFAAAHLAAMHFIVRAAPPELSATAQTVYAAVGMGIVFGATMWAAGGLYAAFGGGAFLAMAGLSAAGGLVALMLAARSRGGSVMR
jgi:PPP family 3-phenylpropionic acid transporter